MSDVIDNGPRLPVPRRALKGTIPEYLQKTGTDLVGRWNPVAEWLGERLDYAVDPYNKANYGRIGPTGRVTMRGGQVHDGVNLASQDYLNLSCHPDVISAAQHAAESLGVHSAGSAALSGNSLRTSELEHRLADFLGYKDCTVFPTGWGAGFGTI